MTNSSPSTPLFPNKLQLWLFLSLAFSLMLLFLGNWVFQQEAATIKAERHLDLKAIATLKIQQIQQWRQQLREDIRMNSTGIVRHLYFQWLETPGKPELKEMLLERLHLFQEYEDGANILIADPQGNIHFSLNPQATSSDPHLRASIQRALASKSVVIGDLFFCPIVQAIRLDVAAPLGDKAGNPRGVIVLRIDPEKFLYPYIQSWPTPSETAETLLIRQEGEEVVFLNRLRHSSEAPLQRRHSLSSPLLPAARAIQGKTGLFEGLDYRGIEVLSHISAVPDSPWFMVSKIDTRELYAEVRLRGKIILAFCLLSILLTLLSGGVAFGESQRRLYRELFLAEQNKREAQEEIRATFYGIGDGVISTNADGNITRMNPIAEALTGWSETEALGQPLDQVFHIISEETRTPVASPVQRVLREGKIIGLANHTLLVSRSGQERPIADSGAPIFAESGTIIGVVLVFRDQTEERTAQNALQQSEIFNRSVMNSIGANIAVLDPQGIIIAVNESWQVFARENGDLSGGAATGPGVNYLEVIKNAREPYLEGAEAATQGIQDLLARRKTECYVEYPCHSEKTKRWFALMATPLKSETGGVILAHINITPRKQAEEALQESESRFQRTLDNMLEGCQIISPAWKYLYINETAAQFGRKPKSELLGNTLMACYPGIEQTAMFSVLRESMEQRIPKHLEFEFSFPDGGSSWFEFSVQPVPEGIFILSLDISPRKKAEIIHQKLEEQLRQAQKMESVGQLAGGVAHDFNNMLGIIIGHTELALLKLGKEDPAVPDLHEVFQAAERSANLTKQLLAFARKQTMNPRVIDLNETITGMLKMLRRLIGENIQLIWKPGAGLWPLKIDPGQIDQILANLSVNARDAISGGGTLAVETANASLDEGFCGNHAEFLPGDYVMLAVSDSGIGMDKEIQRHMFEPFFTTKEIGKGTGLGLATIYGIVKQNAGFINVYSEPGSGTTFKIFFPRSGNGDNPIAATEPVQTLHGTETILLVEDEPGLLNLGRSVLEKNGYHVLAVQTPQEAIEVCSHFDGPIHLLITDVVMPGMNGRMLQEKISAVRPEIRVLFMSGYTANVIAHHGIIDEGIHFLQKPFSIISLSQKVRSLLDQ
jgi:PAS domain S-box-containing protein